MLEIVEEYHARNVDVCFVKLRESCKGNFLRSGIYDLVGPTHFYRKIGDAIEFLRTVNRIRDPRIPNILPPSTSPLPHRPWTVPNRRNSLDSFSDSYQTDFNESISRPGMQPSKLNGGSGGSGSGSTSTKPDSPSPNVYGRNLHVPRRNGRRRGNAAKSEEDVLDLFSDSEFEFDTANEDSDPVFSGLVGGRRLDDELGIRREAEDSEEL